MEILSSVKRLYISFKSLVNDFVYSFCHAALLLLVEVQNHTVPVREHGRIRDIHICPQTKYVDCVVGIVLNSRRSSIGFRLIEFYQNFTLYLLESFMIEFETSHYYFLPQNIKLITNIHYPSGLCIICKGESVQLKKLVRQYHIADLFYVLFKRQMSERIIRSPISDSYFHMLHNCNQLKDSDKIWQIMGH